MVQRRPFNKYLDKGLRWWITKTAKRNLWRVAAWHDLDDLIQEGMLAFCICKNRYGKQVKNKRNFMGLVKVVYANRLTNMANARTRTVEVCVSQIVEAGKERDLLELLGGVEYGEGELYATLRKANKEVQAMLSLFGGDDLTKLRKPVAKRRDGTRETTNEMLCRMIGVQEINLEEQLRELLSAT